MNRQRWWKTRNPDGRTAPVEASFRQVAACPHPLDSNTREKLPGALATRGGYLPWTAPAALWLLPEIDLVAYSPDNQLRA